MLCSAREGLTVNYTKVNGHTSKGDYFDQKVFASSLKEGLLLKERISSPLSYYPLTLVILNKLRCHEPALVAQLDAPSDWRPGGRGFNPRRGRQHSFVEIDH